MTDDNTHGFGPFGRRGLLKGAAGAAGLYLLGDFGGSAPAVAQGDGGEEHFFLFIELRGGIQWGLATDARFPADVTALAAEKKHVFDVAKPLTNDDFIRVAGPEARAGIATDPPRAKVQSPWFAENGDRMLVPFDSRLTGARWEDAYATGNTTLGTPYCLAWPAFALKDKVNRVAVVRGVRSFGFFHGTNNSGDEIFSGNTTGQSHVANVLSKLLLAKGAKLLDNIALENPLIPGGAGVEVAAAIHASGKTLGLLIEALTASDAAAGPIAQRFQRFAALSDGILANARTKLTKDGREVFQAYSRLFGTAPNLQKVLTSIRGLETTDISLDLKAQAKLAITLFQQNLSRVVTLCVGAPNGSNGVDAAGGQFDCHKGGYYGVASADSGGPANTMDHPRQIKLKFDDLAWLLDELGRAEYEGRKLIDLTTVVVSTEFGRYGNFSGTEFFVDRTKPGTDIAPVGNGHNSLNNNYILFGKGIAGGAWIGKTTVASQIRCEVDFAKLGATALDKLHAADAGVFKDPTARPEGAETGSRGFAARDLVKTIMAVAGKEEDYARFYGANYGGDANVIAGVQKKS